jgi:hypothetical protein
MLLSHLMKHSGLLLMILLLYVSCVDPNKTVSDSDRKTSETKTSKERFYMEKNNHLTLSKWVDYYQNLEPKFSLDGFEFKSRETSDIIQGTVPSNYDKNFDSVYCNFLIYRDDRKQYIDFDSYSWSLESGEILWSPDQEINLVDVKNKTVQRIAFRGPSQWVENVFWQDNTTVILLENNYKKQPAILKLDLKNKSIVTFMYKDTLSFDSTYTIWRFEQLRPLSTTTSTF